jgi:hypothetical protein
MPGDNRLGTTVVHAYLADPQSAKNAIITHTLPTSTHILPTRFDKRAAQRHDFRYACSLFLYLKAFPVVVVPGAVYKSFFDKFLCCETTGS